MTKHMKRWIALVLSVVFVLGIVGCGKKPTESTVAPEPSATAESTTIPEPIQLTLTKEIMDDIDSFYGNTMTVHAYLKMVLRISIEDVTLKKQEKFNANTYVYYYTVSFQTSDYRHAQSELRMVVQAYEDSSNAKGYKLKDHCYEGSTQLW